MARMETMILEVEPRAMMRLKELVADPDVQEFPEAKEGGILKLLEIRNLITVLLRDVG